MGMGYLNGSKLPNWFWLVCWGIGIGILLVTNVATKSDIAAQAAQYEKWDIERTRALQVQIQSLDDKVDRRTDQINAELSALSKVTRYVARRVE